MADKPAAAPAAPEQNPGADIPVKSVVPEPVKVAREDDAPVAPATSEGADASAQEQEGGQPAEGEEGAPATEQPRKVQKLPEWAQRQLADQAYRAREATRTAKQLAEDLARARSTQPPGAAPTGQQPAQGGVTQGDVAAAHQASPGGFRSQAEFEAAVQNEANRRLQAEAARRAEAEFNAKCNTVYQSGIEKLGDDFEAAVQNLRDAGAMHPAILEAVLETEAPADVLYKLGADPDQAVALLNMTPTRRAIAIARMAAPAAAPKKEPVRLSNAPRPIPPLEGSARVTNDPRDSDSDREWFAKREQQIRERHRA